MAEGESEKILASVRYYGDETNTVAIVDPALILDYASIETFNFNVPHLIHRIKNGERITELVQVFAISDNVNELIHPTKRRVFDKRRKSDVMYEILEKQKTMIETKTKKSIPSNDDELIDEASIITTSSQSGNSKNIHELKAIEKKIKENARAFSKSSESEILKKKIENLKKNKLVYSDGTDLEKKQKEINDLHMSIELKNGEFEQLKKNQQELEAKIAKYEEDSKFWRSNYEKNQEFMEESKKLIETLQNERQNTAPETIYKSHETLRQKRPPLNSKTALNLHGDHSPDTSAMDSHGDYSFQDFPGHFEDNEEEYSLGILESSRGGKMSTNESLGSGSAKDEENFQYDKKKERSRNEINHKRVKEPREKAIKKKRTAGSDGFDDMSDIEEECEKKSRPKKFKKRFVRTKKYANFHSSSDSECNEKRTFTRGSDDEYEPENLRQSENHQNYKSYYAETGKKRHMYHLMCDISIKYKTWDTLKKIFDMKEWIRVLVHAMFKEEDLIGKTFNLAGCKIDRLPGITRSEFKREEKAAIRQTFFCRCDQVVKRRREAEMYKNNWKSYISEHINSLFMNEKAERAKIEKKQKIKAKATKEPQEQFSLSSDDS